MLRYVSRATWLVVLVASANASVALAQAPPPAAQPGQPAPPPPPGYAQQQPAPPPGYQQQPPPPQAQPPQYPQAQPQPYYYPQQPYQYAPPPPRRRSEPYEEGMPIPPGAHVEERPRTGLVIAGAVIFGVSYLSAVFVWYLDFIVASGDSELWGLLIPIAGPLVLVPSADEELVPLLVFDFLAQATGMTLFVLGLAAQRKVIIYADAERRTELALVPSIGGLAFQGRF